MVSIVIPALNESRRIDACLASVIGEADAVGAEVLVVDGGSSDDTRERVRRAGVRLASCAAGRGRQMNEGVRRSRGSLLVFLPADTELPGGALRRLDAIDRLRRPVAGGLRQRFDRSSPVLHTLSAVHNLRARLTGVFYGDQVPFVRRDLFERIGGYREDIDMEDVELGSRLSRHCSPVRLELTATTSARRFEHAGDLRASLVAISLAFTRAVFRRPPRSRTFFTPIRGLPPFLCLFL